MKRRILKKFVKAYRPYERTGPDKRGYYLGMKEESYSANWEHGHLRFWTSFRNKERKYLRKLGRKYY